MKKIIIIIALLLAVLVLVGCGKQEELLTIGETTQSYTQSYIIDGNKNASQQLYGTVMIEDIQNIMTSIGGTLSFLNCQEGKKVTADTLIAKITPNEENATIQNLRLQQELLETQLKNLKETYNMTEENFEIQKESLRAQTEHTQDIYDQNSPDLENLKNSIKNFKAQQETNINDALKKVRENGGSAYRSDLYEDLYYDRYRLEKMSDKNFSEYLEDMSKLMGKAAKYTSSDALYAMFIGLANGFGATKSAFDNLAGSYESAQNAYKNQRDNLALTIDLADEQILALENTKHMQLLALEGQMQTIQLNINSLGNSLKGERIYADIDGTVKMRGAGEGNMVGPNTMLCQITSSDSSSRRIQLFSSQRIKRGTKAAIYANDKFIMTGIILYELPYKDTTTQNYIYEIPRITNALKDQERVVIQINQESQGNEIWIPLEYVQPRLEGNMVRRKNGEMIEDIAIQLGTINDNMIQVVSGLDKGDEIVK